jgi:hypothetical protein
MKEQSRLPTNKYHRPILHILQFTHASVFGLFALNRHPDQIKKLSLSLIDLTTLVLDASGRFRSLKKPKFF